MIEAAKIGCLFVGIWFTYVNVAKTVRGHGVSSTNLMVMSAAMTGFAYLQFLGPVSASQ